METSDQAQSIKSLKHKLRSPKYYQNHVRKCRTDLFNRACIWNFCICMEPVFSYNHSHHRPRQLLSGFINPLSAVTHWEIKNLHYYYYWIMQAQYFTLIALNWKLQWGTKSTVSLLLILLGCRKSAERTQDCTQSAGVWRPLWCVMKM